MDETGDFFSGAVNTARDVLAELVTRAGLHLRPELLSRGMARQCRVRLSFLMNYIRQLIFLMAAGMIDALTPVKPQAGATRAKLPSGVQDVTASFVAASGPRPWRFALAPAQYVPIPDMPDISGKPAPDEVPAGRFIEKVIVLGRILGDPAPHAKRMARALRRWRTAGEMAPVSLQAVPRFRAGRLTESFAQVLSVRLNDALAVAWNDSG